MPTPLLQAPYQPDWVERRSASLSRMFDNGLADSSDADDGTVSGGRVHDFHGSTAAGAASRLERVHAQRDLLAAGKQAAAVSVTGPSLLRSVAAMPDETFEGGGSAPHRPIPDEYGSPQPSTGPGSAPSSTPPTPAAAPQPAPLAPSGPAIPAPEQTPTLPPAAAPGTDPFGLPDAEGRKEGDEWDTVLEDGRIVHNRIPFGNDYNAGTPTTSRPDRSHLTTPDYQGTVTPSFDAAGNHVGYDIAYLDEHGLYDNHHVDLYDNVTLSRTAPDGNGGITSTFI